MSIKMAKRYIEWAKERSVSGSPLAHNYLRHAVEELIEVVEISAAPKVVAGPAADAARRGAMSTAFDQLYGARGSMSEGFNPPGGWARAASRHAVRGTLLADAVRKFIADSGRYLADADLAPLRKALERFEGP